MIYLGSDHRGFTLKEAIKKWLTARSLKFVDQGDIDLDPDDDYVDFASKVAEAVAQDPTNRGILLCGSGVGVDITANKIKGVRSALVDTEDKAKAARADDDVNVLSLAADSLTSDQATLIVQAFLTTPFSKEDRFKRRLDKLANLEKNS